MTVANVLFEDYATSIPKALDAINAGPVLAEQSRIVLKPNLVEGTPHPITTPPECVEAVWAYCRAHSQAEILVAEGSGGDDTGRVFRELGYTAMADRTGAALIDLDQDEPVVVENPAFTCLPTFHVPRCLIDAFIISIPVLKAHSMSKVTLSLKNMFGIAPAHIYGGSAFRKSKLHGGNNDELHHYVVELNQYCRPALAVIDATIGMAQAHLWGPECDPPVNRLLASFDPVAADAEGARLLGVDWREVGHIALADGLLGHVETE